MTTEALQILQLFDVWKAYNGVQALRGLNLEVLRGEIFGLVGPNGAGKTTALKIIVGLLKMDRGAVRVNGVNIEDEPIQYKRFIGYVPEVVTLPDYLTIEEFLIYSGRIRGVPDEEIRERMNFYINEFDLSDKGKTLILGLSKGMRQKVAVASALIHDPELLILDEPLVGIDPAGQHKLKELFSERIERGKTVFISTHMLDTAERICNRVAIIHKGKNVAAGDLRSLREMSRSGESSTLEEVFLKLTEEAEKESQIQTSEEPLKKRPSLWHRFRKV
ncbi:MAG: ABC transporter ATP-binding protein [Nitrososphaerota archaeon]|nr:ABC transporter ATP-binding protein [Candidatus Bathyarchaeota archaeon]MDW8049236.1 ABC transporter ATP-binding protein [Nitrososphaerota archaeon]